jgi:hypothetical protein
MLCRSPRSTQILSILYSHAQTINEHITTNFAPMLQNVVLDGETQPAPKQLEWYPDLLAWQLNVPKRTIRKSPEYKVFQSFLVGETEIVRNHCSESWFNTIDH